MRISWAWPYLTHLLRGQTEVLQLRQQVEEAASVWAKEGKRGGLWNDGSSRLPRAEELLAAGRLRLSEKERAFLRASREAVTRRRRIERGVSVLLLAMVVAVGGFGVVAQRARHRAVASQRQAEQSQHDAERSQREVERSLREARAQQLEALAASTEDPLGVLGDVVRLFQESREPVSESYRRALMAALLAVWNRPLLRGHTGAITSAALSPDGSRISTGSMDGTARLWNTINGAPGVVLRGHDGPVRRVAFSPDGRQLATADSLGAVRLWNTETAQLTATLTGSVTHTVPTDLRFLPDPRYVAVLADVARVWDTQTNVVTSERPHRQTVLSTWFFGTLLADVGSGTLSVWDAVTNEQVLHTRVDPRFTRSNFQRGVRPFVHLAGEDLESATPELLEASVSVVDHRRGQHVVVSASSTSSVEAEVSQDLLLRLGGYSPTCSPNPLNGVLSIDGIGVELTRRQGGMVARVGHMQGDGMLPMVLARSEDRQKCFPAAPINPWVGEDHRLELQDLHGSVVRRSQEQVVGSLITSDFDHTVGLTVLPRGDVSNRITDRSYELWDLAGPARLTPNPLWGELQFPIDSIDRGGEWVAVRTEFELRLWNTTTRVDATPPSLRDASVRGAALSGDGSALLTIDDTHALHLYGTGTFAEQSRALLPDRAVQTALLSFDASLIALIDLENRASLWRRRSPGTEYEFETQLEGDRARPAVFRFLRAGGGEWLVTGGLYGPFGLLPADVETIYRVACALLAGSSAHEALLARCPPDAGTLLSRLRSALPRAAIAATVVSPATLAALRARFPPGVGLAVPLSPLVRAAPPEISRRANNPELPIMLVLRPMQAACLARTGHRITPASHATLQFFLSEGERPATASNVTYVSAGFEEMASCMVRGVRTAAFPRVLEPVSTWTVRLPIPLEESGTSRVPAPAADAGHANY